MEKTYWEELSPKAMRQYENLRCDKLSEVMSRHPAVTTIALFEHFDAQKSSLKNDTVQWFSEDMLNNIRAKRTLVSREDVVAIAEALSELREETVQPQDIAPDYIKDIFDIVSEMIREQRQEIAREKQLPPQDEQYGILLGYLQGICKNMSAPKYSLLIAGFDVCYHMRDATFEFLLQYLALNEKGRAKAKELVHERQPNMAGVLTSIKHSKCVVYMLPLFQSALAKELEADQYLYMTENERWEALKSKLDEKYEAGDSEFDNIAYFILKRAECFPDMIISFNTITVSKQIKENEEFWGVALAYELLSYYKEGSIRPRKSKSQKFLDDKIHSLAQDQKYCAEIPIK